MARPRLIRPDDGGEIKLTNCSAATIERVQKIMEGAPTVEAAPEAPASMPAGSETGYTGECPQSAVGIFKGEKGKWCTAFIKFNPETRECQLAEVVPHDYKDIAQEAFRIYVGRYLFT